MRLTLIGVNHRTAPVALREQLALAGDRLEQFLAGFRAQFADAEVIPLSTCNRTEIYVAHPLHHRPGGAELRALLAQTAGVPLTEVEAHTIQRQNEQVIHHLFRVLCGLESMVLGEMEILGQTKRAYEQAVQRGHVAGVLHTVFQQGFAAAKHIRSQTGIDAGRRSVASVAIDFARQIFDDFTDKVVVGVGAGEMIKLTLRHLLELHPRQICLANRTPARAADLLEFLQVPATLGSVRSLDDLDQLLVEADILVTCTGSPEALITANRFRSMVRLRRYRPLFIIDMAVPRDVTEDVAGLPNVYLYNIDDLQQVIASNAQQRQQEVAAAELLLGQMVQQCHQEIMHRDLGQLIAALRTQLHGLGAREQERTLKKLANCPPEQLPRLLEEHTQRLVNKILHLPLSQLDRRNADTPFGFYAAALRRLFQLESTAGLPLPDSTEADWLEPDAAPEQAAVKPMESDTTSTS